jgi:hypothetical protein
MRTDVGKTRRMENESVRKAQHVDVEPAGMLIVRRNKHIPGVIGRVWTLLGDHGNNIAGYRQARMSRGGDAPVAVAVDGPVTTWCGTRSLTSRR